MAIATAVAAAVAATYILYAYMVNRSSRLVRLLERGGELSSNLIEWAKLLTKIPLGRGWFYFWFFVDRRIWIDYIRSDVVIVQATRGMA